MELSKIRFIISMAIFGTIGLFVRMIPFPSSVISMCRGFFGAVFLIIYIVIAKKDFSFNSVKSNIFNLTVSGAVIGVNWILLFESYKYTSIAKATLCYYMAPVFIILISPFVFKEKITLEKGICVIVSFVGMLFISGVIGDIKISGGEIKGVLLGLSSAVAYSLIIIFNKKMKNIGALERTVIQLSVCGIVMFFYSLFGDLKRLEFTAAGMSIMLLVCVIHTGLAYLFYFGSIGKIKAQSIAILSFVDPVVALIVSAVILREPTGIYGILGAVMIIGSAVFA